MYCLNCGEAQGVENIQFCRKCGHDLTGPDGGRGFKQGFVLIAFGLLMVPIWMFIGAIFPPNDRFVESSPSTTWAEQIAWIFMWVAFLAGAARILYALFFENTLISEAIKRDASLPNTERNALPSGEEFEGIRPGKWRTTDELLQPIFRDKARTSGDL